MTDRRSRSAVEMAAPGIAHPSAAEIGRIRALTPRVAGQFLPGGSVLERPEPQPVTWRGRHPVHPRIRGDFVQPSCIDREVVFDRRPMPVKNWPDTAANRAMRSSGCLGRTGIEAPAACTSARADPPPVTPAASL